MKKPIFTLWLAAVLALGLLSTQLYAQPPEPQSSQQQNQQKPGDQPGQQAPSTDSSRQQSDVQIFTGVIAKTGDKYVLQDSANGTSYNIDQQELAKKYEGQKVRIKGTLDPDGKTIHVK
jgi:uncharacterized protein YdeI (BOF family)